MVIEVIHTNGLSDIINPARIDGVAESKNCGIHLFTLYSNNTRWEVTENDKIILSEMNMNYNLLDREISFDDFKSNIKGIMVDSQITRL